MYFSEKPSTNEDAELTTGIHTLPIIWIFNKDTWPADARAFPPPPTHFLREKPWGRGCWKVGKTRNIDAIQLVLQQCCKASCTFFFLPLEWPKVAWAGGGGVCTQARPEVNMHKRNHEKDSGNSIMKIWPWGRGKRGTPVAQASIAHIRVVARRTKMDARCYLVSSLFSPTG